LGYGAIISDPSTFHLVEVSMLEVWGRKTSSNVQALMWCIGELNLEYRRHDVGHRFGGNDTAEFLALNPNGTVPVLRDGVDSEPLWETGAILRYLAENYAMPPFWPEKGLARARVDKWAEWSKINVTKAFTQPIFWRVVRTPPSRRDPAAIQRGLAQLSPLLVIAERQLADHDYLAGEVFTLADIQFGHVLFRYYDINIARDELPHLRRYYERLATRPAFREHVMVSYEDLREHD
jgi:glutathione S-transferase